MECSAAEIDVLLSAPEKYIGEPISVTFTSGSKTSGNVYSIDPCNSMLTILGFKSSVVSSVRMIPRCAVEHIVAIREGEQLPDDCVANNAKLRSWMSNLFRDTPTHADGNALRKHELFSWLSSKNVPVTESANDSLSIMGCATINPPYSPDDCVCDNFMILLRVRSLIEEFIQSKKSTV